MSRVSLLSRVLLLSFKFSHVRPLLHTLHWHRNENMINLKIAPLLHLSLKYISDVLQL